MAKKENSLGLSPLRSLDDFLLGSARFQLPNFNDMEKWGNRVVQNLLYYQTNYFLLSLVLVSIVTVLYPGQMACGCLSILFIYAMFYFLANSTTSMTKFKKEHPALSIVLILLGGCLVIYMLGSLIIFLFGILLPISITFIHASLRLRNLTNKLSNIKRVVSNKTPMEVLLDAFDLEHEITF